MEETKVFRTSLINFLCFQFPSAAAFFSNPPTTEQPAPATAQPTPPADPSEGAGNTEQLNLSAEDIFDWHTPMEHQSQLKQADIPGSSKAEDATAPVEPPAAQENTPRCRGKTPAKRQRRYHAITTDNDDESSAGLPAANPEQMQRRSIWIISYGKKRKELHFKEYMIQGFCQNQSIPLEVPGNRLPKTGSRRTLLPARGFPARSDQPRQISFILDSQYFLHSSSGEKFVERKIYLFDIGRVKLKKRMNAVHVRDQKHELTLPRNSFSAEGYHVQARQIVTGLRDKPVTQQDALPKSEYQPRYLPGQDPLSMFETSPLSSCLSSLSKHLHRRR
ncbi:hypothetical protein V6N11_072907 [Hibiscus sabdariffa]|uniref:Uncharacterized protein n=1 Tax=Hibiscus sabdariffa TaxID=183260 RepID=A0ABR2P0W2_9ROSI